MSDNNGAPPQAPESPSGKRHIDAALGNRLRIRREMFKLGVDQLAGRIGCDPALLAAYESGAKRCPAVELEKLARTLNVSVAWLFADIVAAAPAADVPSPEAGLPSQVVDFAQVRPDHQVLLEFFGRIRSPSLRHAVVDMARSLAEYETRAAEGS